MSRPGPVLLDPNQPVRRPYRGGAGIARWRGLPAGRDDVPEDFLGSTTQLSGSDGIGLTVLPDGRTLRERVQEDPEAFLGPDHVAVFGADPALLVKMLDTQERLFVHFHPDDDFAAAHLGSRFGKTEAWHVVDVATPDGTSEAYLGFTRGVDPAQVRAWVDRQDVAAMLAALNRVIVRAGDSLFVPGGVPHAIGTGITLVELQEPTDFSILLEWSGYGVGPDDAHLGLGLDAALTALDFSGWQGDRLDALVSGEQRPTDQPGVTRLFPPIADRFFRAERLQLREPVTFPPGFSVIVVLGGEGELRTSDASLSVRRGSAVLVPYAAGDIEIAGEVQGVRCQPPLTRAGFDRPVQRA